MTPSGGCRRGCRALTIEDVNEPRPIEQPDTRRARRRRIKDFWAEEGLGGVWLGRRKVSPADHEVMRRSLVGGELPEDEAGWDLHLDWRRAQRDLEASDVDEQTAAEVANVLTRAHHAISSTSIRRLLHRRNETPGTAETGKTRIRGKSDRTKSRRSSNAA